MELVQPRTKRLPRPCSPGKPASHPPSLLGQVRSSLHRRRGTCPSSSSRVLQDGFEPFAKIRFFDLPLAFRDPHSVRLPLPRAIATRRRIAVFRSTNRRSGSVRSFVVLLLHGGISLDDDLAQEITHRQNSSGGSSKLTLEPRAVCDERLPLGEPAPSLVVVILSHRSRAQDSLALTKSRSRRSQSSFPPPRALM